MGAFFSRKLGPLRTWHWFVLVLALGAAYVLYKRRKAGSGTSSTTPSTSTGSQSDYVPASPSPTDAALAGQPSQNSAPAASLSPDVLDALTQTFGAGSPLVSGLEDLATATSTASPSGYTAATGVFPGAPLQTVTPTPGALTGGVTPTTTVAKAPPAPAPKPKAITYYTYKKNVPLKKGETLHFAKGKGYYAA